MYLKCPRFNPQYHGLRTLGRTEYIKSLALNKPVAASADEKGAPLAVDNNPSTRWRPGKNIGECWLRVDLGTAQQVGAMRVGLNFSDIGKFTLEYQENDEWKIAYQGVNMSRDEYSATFLPVKAQKIRLHILRSNGDLSIGSFELFKPE